MAKYRVLSTKKLEPALLEEARNHHLEIREEEFISVRPIESPEKREEIFHWLHAGMEYVVFTSANALIPFRKFPYAIDTSDATGWKIFCLTGRTRNELAKSSLSIGHIAATADNAAALAEKIMAQQVRELIFFCGNNRREELPRLLSQAGITVHEVIVYETKETPVEIKDDLDAVLFFSPSAVSSFFSVNKLRQDAVCFAIGKTTAQRIRAFTGNRIVTAGSPSQAALIRALAENR